MADFKDYRFDIVQNGDVDGVDSYIPHQVWINHLSAELTKRHGPGFVISGDPRLDGGNHLSAVCADGFEDSNAADYMRDEIERIYEDTCDKTELWESYN